MQTIIGLFNFITAICAACFNFYFVSLDYSGMNDTIDLSCIVPIAWRYGEGNNGTNGPHESNDGCKLLASTSISLVLIGFWNPLPAFSTNHMSSHSISPWPLLHSLTENTGSSLIAFHWRCTTQCCSRRKDIRYMQSRGKNTSQSRNRRRSASSWK